MPLSSVILGLQAPLSANFFSFSGFGRECAQSLLSLLPLFFKKLLNAFIPYSIDKMFKSAKLMKEF